MVSGSGRRRVEEVVAAVQVVSVVEQGQLGQRGGRLLKICRIRHQVVVFGWVLVGGNFWGFRYFWEAEIEVAAANNQRSG